MKLFKNFLALMLALMLVLGLCACGESGAGTNNENPGSAPTISTPQNPTEGSSAPTIPDGMVQYKVKVVDEANNPIVGVMVQLCTDETCLIPVKTDDAGVATFAPAAEGEYHANFLPKVPDGYEADAEVFYFASGETELTIVLKAVA